MIQISAYVFRFNKVKSDDIGKENKSMLISQKVSNLKEKLYYKFNINFTLDGALEKGYFNLDDIEDREEWTQFYFKFVNDNKGIHLKHLKLAKGHRYKGVGSCCVSWLKDFCKEFGFSYIVLGSLKEAEGFWSKMGFRELPTREAAKICPWD